MHRDREAETSEEQLVSLIPLKHKWKNATVDVPLYCFSSKASFEYAFTELFMCKEIRMEGEARFNPHPLMRLASILQCSKLNLVKLDHLVAVNDVLEWVERENPKQWDEPTCLEVRSDRLVGGHAGLLDTLKKVRVANICGSFTRPRVRCTMQCLIKRLGS